MRICLIHPPSPFLIDQGVFGPLGLWYLQAVLQKAGHTVTTVDLGLRPGRHLPKADVYGVTGTTPQAPGMKRVMGALREEGKPVVAGGPHATLYPEGCCARAQTWW